MVTGVINAPWRSSPTWRLRKKSSRARRRRRGHGKDRADRSLLAPKFEVARHSSLSFCLRLVTGAVKSGPRFAPVVGAFRGPDEIRLSYQAFERPSSIIRNVGGETK